MVNGTDEFEATLQELQAEVRRQQPLQGAQNVHAWVSLGDDTIIDAALPPRLVRHYRAPPEFEDMIFIGRGEEMLLRYRCQRTPLLVGTEFFAKTNPLTQWAPDCAARPDRPDVGSVMVSDLTAYAAVQR